jgi:hypothetical protein
MFTTVQEVRLLTGRNVLNDIVIIAQSLVETYIGRVELEITNPTDRALLAKAVAYQAAYIQENPGVMFDQAATRFITTGASSVSFDTALFAPFLSPWTARACKQLSWNGSRSVRTGKSVQRRGTGYPETWTHDVVRN